MVAEAPIEAPIETPVTDLPRPAPVRALRWLRRLLLGAVFLGVLLLCAGALATGVLASRAEERYPRLGQSIQVDGLRQQVLIEGQGAPVVFVHGAYGGMHDFAATILERTSQLYRCIVWDRPGHGYSERPEGDVDPGVQGHLLLGLIEKLGLEQPPLLVGFSYGGTVCLAAALEDPSAVRGVVLMNTPSHPWPDPLRVEYRVAGIPVVGWLLSETLVAPVGTWASKASVAKAFSPLPIPAAFDASPLGLAVRPSAYRANTEDVRLLKPFLREQSKRYGDLVTPVIALVSEGDIVVSPTIHLPQLVEQAPNTRQVRVDGAGHQVLYTHPELVLELIAQAMEETR